MDLGDVRDWVKNNAVPALTVAGLGLYILLRLPYAIYYGRLGVAPEDAGLTYVELLARSSAGVVAIALFVALSAVVLVFAWLWFGMQVRTLAIVRTLDFRTLWRRSHIFLQNAAPMSCGQPGVPH